jgi:signal peptidase II
LGRIAEIFPADGGYAPLLQGKVVDMLYFPLYSGTLPDWVPAWGGEYFIFFRPIFNLADSAISIGVVLLLLFQKRIFPKT